MDSARYKAKVTNNIDHDGQGKIEVNCPDISAEPIWTRPVGFISSSLGGLWMLPEIGDLVEIYFEMDNPEFPVWDFRFWFLNAIPEKITELYEKAMIFQMGVNMLILNKEEAETTLTNGTSELKLVDEKILLNGDGNDGMVKIVPLVQKINALENKVNELATAVSTPHIHGHPQGPTLPNSAPSISQLSTTSQSDIENPNVTHG